MATSAVAQTTVAADTFVDTAGVNIHLHYDGTVYRDNFPLIQTRLAELGIRHVRDGLIDTTWQAYYDRHNALGRAGIKSDFITSPNLSTTLLQDYPIRMADSFEAYEAPNEYNLSGDPQWTVTMRATLEQLHALRNQPSLARFPVFGPSLTDGSADLALGDVSSLIDFGNMHNYFSGRNPGTTGWGEDGYGSIDWNLRMLALSAGDRPAITTETGYTNDAALPASIPESVAATYMPRVLIEQFIKGIRRTYIYELCDLPSSGVADQSGYGLLRSDGTAKPAFGALKGLLALLADPGPVFAVTPLPYMLLADQDIHSMAFQKRDGTYYLALWVEAPAFDMNTGTAIVVPAQSATIKLSKPYRLLSVNQWQPDGSVIESASSEQTASFSLSITDRLQIVELRGIAPTAPTDLRIIYN
jgi:hypothetical protein